MRVHVDAAKIGKRGACHLLRHTMATLMLEGGADIRHDLKTTQIYTQVSIRQLKQIHAGTHPAQLPPEKTPTNGDGQDAGKSQEAADLLAALDAEASEDLEDASERSPQIQGRVGTADRDRQG